MTADSEITSSNSSNKQGTSPGRPRLSCNSGRYTEKTSKVKKYGKNGRHMAETFGWQQGHIFFCTLATLWSSKLQGLLQCPSERVKKKDLSLRDQLTPKVLPQFCLSGNSQRLWKLDKNWPLRVNGKRWVKGRLIGLGGKLKFTPTLGSRQRKFALKRNPGHPANCRTTTEFNALDVSQYWNR